MLGVTLILAAFRVDVPMLRGGSPVTWHGWVHGIAFLLIIAVGVLAPPMMALAMRGDAGWRLIGVVSLVARALFVAQLPRLAANGQAAGWEGVWEIVSDLDLTSNQVWGLTKTEEEWSTALEAALMATRPDDLEHGTNAAYVAGSVCKGCRVHQRERMAKNRRTG